MIEVLENALVSLRFADSEMAIEPYEHCSGEAVDAHYLLRDTIKDLDQLLKGIKCNKEFSSILIDISSQILDD